MPRGGARGQAILNVIIERWSRLVQARVESLLEAYEQYEIKFEKSDVEDFINRLNSAHPSILTSFMHYAGERGHGTSTHLDNEFEQINREARQKLLFEITKAELKRKKLKKERKMKKKQTVGLNISGPVVGSSIQVGGKENKAKVTASLNTQFNQTIDQLREAFEESKELDKADKEEALKRIEKLTVLADREENPKGLQKVKRGIETLASIASKARELIGIVGPLIERIKEHWPNIQW